MGNEKPKRKDTGVTWEEYIDPTLNEERDADGTIIRKCKDCGAEFNINGAEQAFYKNRGFDLPSRCKPCKDIRKKVKRNNSQHDEGKAFDEALAKLTEVTKEYTEEALRCAHEELEVTSPSKVRMAPRSELVTTPSMLTYDDEFADRLTSIMWLRGLTSSDLSRKIGMSDPMVSHYIRGDSKPSVSVLLALSDALEVSIDWLVGRADKESGMSEDDALKLREHKEFERVCVKYDKSVVFDALVDMCRNEIAANSFHGVGSDDSVIERVESKLKKAGGAVC